MARFASAHARDLTAVHNFRRLCSPKIGHDLVAFRDGGFIVVHNIHVNASDDLDYDGGEDLWALMGSGGGIAATMTIDRMGA